jgi:hypothetical protein
MVRDDGLITEDEFVAKRTAILGEVQRSSCPGSWRTDMPPKRNARGRA